MSITVRIPTPLRALTEGQSEVKATAGSVGELIETLEGQYRGIRARLCDDQGQLRRFINIYVNEEDIRFLQGAQTPLKAGDQVSIVPAIAGGTRMRLAFPPSPGRRRPSPGRGDSPRADGLAARGRFGSRGVGTRRGRRIGD